MGKIVIPPALPEGVRLVVPVMAMACGSGRSASASLLADALADAGTTVVLDTGPRPPSPWPAFPFGQLQYLRHTKTRSLRQIIGRPIAAEQGDQRSARWVTSVLRPRCTECAQVAEATQGEQDNRKPVYVHVLQKRTPQQLFVGG